jgi:uncharacterized protein YciI
LFGILAVYQFFPLRVQEATMKHLTATLIVTFTLAMLIPPVNAQQQPKTSVYAIILRLSPEFTAQIARPGVVDAVADAARAGHAPAVQELVNLGQTEKFAKVFVERLGYLLRLRQTGILRAAGPFEDLKDGMYLCNATDESEARRVLEEDPLYRAGFIEREFTVRRWLVAI